MNLEFQWSEKKALDNARKHGVSFEAAILIFEGPTLDEEDTRKNYGETRFVAFGMLDCRLLAVVYTDRDDVRRIISARKANAREQRAYRQALARWAAPDG